MTFSPPLTAPSKVVCLEVGEPGKARERAEVVVQVDERVEVVEGELGG